MSKLLRSLVSVVKADVVDSTGRSALHGGLLSAALQQEQGASQELNKI